MLCKKFLIVQSRRSDFELDKVLQRTNRRMVVRTTNSNDTTHSSWFASFMVPSNATI